jgi:hypothetical protein
MCVPEDDFISSVTIFRTYEDYFQPALITFKDKMEALYSLERESRLVCMESIDSNYFTDTKLWKVVPKHLTRLASERHSQIKNMLFSSVGDVYSGWVTSRVIFDRATKIFTRDFWKLITEEDDKNPTTRLFWLDLLVREGRLITDGSIETARYKAKTNKVTHTSGLHRIWLPPEYRREQQSNLFENPPKVVPVCPQARDR